MPDTKSVLLVGVGGQGTVLAGKILSNALLAGGYDVKMSEVHGMAQRGGAVSAQVRFGSAVLSPIAGRGGADFLVSFEAMEALRWLPFAGPDCRAIVNARRIPPAPVLMGKAEYPEDALAEVEARMPVIPLDADAIAAALGDERAMNLVLLGALAAAMGLVALPWERTIADCVKASFVELDVAAFRAGISTIEGRGIAWSAR